MCIAKVLRLLKSNRIFLYQQLKIKRLPLITLEGYITTFEITLASTDDREGLRNIIESRTGLVILGDKGYVITLQQMY